MGYKWLLVTSLTCLLLSWGLCQDSCDGFTADDGGWRFDPASESSFPGGCNIRTVDGSFTAEEFQAIATEPVLIVNASQTSFKKMRAAWKRDAFLDTFGDFTAKTYPRHMFETRPLGFEYPTFKEFVQKQMNGTELPSLQKWQVLNFHDTNTELASHLQRLFAFPDMLPYASFTSQHAWSISLGASGAGLTMHSTHPAAWIAVVYGKKFWHLAAPAAFAKNSTAYWGFGPKALLPNNWDRMLDNTKTCVQLPGTILYIPHYWWHGTVNLGETISLNVEVDENFAEKDLGNEGLKSSYWQRKQLLDKVKEQMTSPGQLSQKQLKKLAKTVLLEVHRDPLQILSQDVSLSMYLWQFMLRIGQIERFADALKPIVSSTAKWLRRGQISAEGAISQMISAFPWGISFSGIQTVVDLTKKMANLGHEAAFDGANWSSKWGEMGLGGYTLRADGTPYVAAMFAEIGQTDLALEVMKRTWDLGFVKTQAAFPLFFSPRLKSLIPYLAKEKKYKRVSRQLEKEVEKVQATFR